MAPVHTPDPVMKGMEGMGAASTTVGTPLTADTLPITTSVVDSLLMIGNGHLRSDKKNKTRHCIDC